MSQPQAWVPDAVQAPVGQGNAVTHALAHMSDHKYLATPERLADFEVDDKTSQEAVGQDDDGPVDGTGYQTDNENESELKHKLGDEVRYSRSTEPLAERKTKSTKRNLQAASYLVLVEDRLKELEDKFQQLEARPQGADSGNESVYASNASAEQGAAAQAPWIAKPAMRTWKDFITPNQEEAKKGTHVLEVLNEPPHPLDNLQKNAKALRRIASNQSGSARIERIRINSKHICSVFESIMGRDFAPQPGFVHRWPFKAFLAYEKDLRNHFNELKERLANTPEIDRNSHNEDVSVPGQPLNNISDMTRSTAFHHGSMDAAFAPTYQSDAAHRSADDPEVQREVLEHLGCLIDFFDAEFKEDLITHQRFRARDLSRHEARITFDKLWHLFAPGDIIYEPKMRRALQVLAVKGGRVSLKQRVRDPFKDPMAYPGAYPGHPPAVESTVAPAGGLLPLIDDESISPFVITCFYLNFNGEQIGPIHCEKEITPFDGTRDIFNLPFFPIEYADFHDHQYAENENDDAPKPEKAVKVLLQERGERFAKLVSSKEVAHMEYSGCVVRHNTPL